MGRRGKPGIGEAGLAASHRREEKQLPWSGAALSTTAGVSCDAPRQACPLTHAQVTPLAPASHCVQLLPNTSSGAKRHGGGQTEMAESGAEKVTAGPGKGNGWLMLQNPSFPDGLGGGSVYRQNLGWGLKGCVAFLILQR